MALTATKKKFAAAILAGKTNKEAAIAADLSVKTASAAGTRMSKDKDVVAFLAKARTPGEFPDPGAPKDPAWPFGTGPVSTPGQEASAEQPKQYDTAEAFLRDMMNDPKEDAKLRLDAAKKLMDFEKPKPAPVGKKQSQADEAKKGSRFSAAAPPKLAATGGKRV